jgi:recombinational DNA repair protein (RecF pathway)
MIMQIPPCEDHQGNTKEDHCWHPGSAWVQAPQFQRCCHCGLDFSIQKASFADSKEHGYHARNRCNGHYEIVFNTEYKDMYKKDPEVFEKLDAALEEGRKIREALNNYRGYRQL